MSEEHKQLVTDCNHLNGAKVREDEDWLSELVSLINGEIAHYMSQDADCFSVDCGPWHIQYDKAKGEDDGSK